MTDNDSNGLIRVFYTNADNLMNKLDELRVRSSDSNFDVMVVTEVYPKFGDSRDILPPELQIKGYNMYMSKVESNSRGIIIYIRETIRSDLNLTLTNFDFNESVWVNLYLQNDQSLLIGGIYRSPNSSLENTLKMLDLLYVACGNNPTLKVIVGDFNFPEIDWLSWTTVKSETHYSFKFLECLRDNYLEQLVQSPTRWRDLQPGSLLDLILTDCEEYILNLETTNHLGNSDHLSLEFLIDCTSEKNVGELEKRNFYRGDYILANRKIADIHWENLHNMNQQEGWDYFYSVINQVVEDCVPKVKSLHKKPKPAWMDNYCIKLVRKKKRAWRKYSHSRNIADFYKYCSIRNKATRSVRFAKRRYEKGIAASIKDNPKSFWSFVREKTNVKSGINDLQNDQGEKIKEDTEKCELLNDFFTSVFTNEQSEPPTFDSQIDNNISEIQVTKEKVLNLLKNVNPSKSAGADGLHPRFIKETAETLTLPVFILFNKSLSEGSVPDIFKKANVTPIHKSGDKALPKNYRPISVTPILCRLLETIVREVITQHIKTNNIIINQQYGFREKRGCVLQLLKVLDQIVTSLENGNPVDMIYLDIQKAFDSVPHKRLL
ncbi:MAG: reverse transcriptase family protein, partial [Candidatus Thiodiazotropha sp.]